MAKPSGLPPRPKGERSIVKTRFDGTRQRTRRPCAPLLEGTRERTRRSWAHLGTRPRPRRLLASLSSSRKPDRDTNGLISAPGTRTPSATHETIESAAESEIGPNSLAVGRKTRRSLTQRGTINITLTLLVKLLPRGHFLITGPCESSFGTVTTQAVTIPWHFHGSGKAASAIRLPADSHLGSGKRSQP